MSFETEEERLDSQTSGVFGDRRESSMKPLVHRHLIPDRESRKCKSLTTRLFLNFLKVLASCSFFYLLYFISAKLLDNDLIRSKSGFRLNSTWQTLVLMSINLVGLEVKMNVGNVLGNVW